MPTITSETTTRPSNPLTLPLLIVSLVAAVELVGLIVMAVALTRRPEPLVAAPAGQGAAVAQTPPAPPAPPATPAADKAPPHQQPTNTSAPKGGGEKGFVVGKKGQRVESAGFAITVEEIRHEPYYKNLADPTEDQKYLALLIAVENNTGGNAMLFDAMFHLQDDKGYTYDKLGMALTTPKLEWRTMGNRDTVRGYLDFIVPKSAKGLTLVYSHLPRGDSQPIHVELGE